MQTYEDRPPVCVAAPQSSIQATVLQLEAVARDFLALRADLTANDSLNLHLVVAAVHVLLARITAAEALGVPPNTIRTLLSGVRNLHGKSPLIGRMQRWPRGYVGDFETVEMILSGKCMSEIGTLPYYLERYVLDCPASQQHRNKVVVQADLIRFSLLRNSNARILILACGSCPDVKLVSKDMRMVPAQLWLNDADEAALAFSTSALNGIWPNIRTEWGNVVEFLKTVRSLPKFDLIVAGGLFDYLEDRTVEFVIKRSYNQLEKGGKFFFTNMGCNNPYRPWMEYCGDWFLTMRSAACIGTLAEKAGISQANIKVSEDTTGLTHLVEITSG